MEKVKDIFPLLNDEAPVCVYVRRPGDECGSDKIYPNKAAVPADVQEYEVYETSFEMKDNNPHLWLEVILNA